jgi:hypothetical protein
MRVYPKQSHPKWTIRYEYWTLVALGEVSGPQGLKAIYSRVHALLKRENLLAEGEESEWRIRWTLSNAGKKGRVKNTAPHEGEWEITDEGRFWLTADLLMVKEEELIQDI